MHSAVRAAVRCKAMCPTHLQNSARDEQGGTGQGSEGGNQDCAAVAAVTPLRLLCLVRPDAAEKKVVGREPSPSRSPVPRVKTLGAAAATRQCVTGCPCATCRPCGCVCGSNVEH